MSKAIPEGMHVVTPHLICAGAADAIEFYKKAFGATEVARMPCLTARSCTRRSRSAATR
jgi:uncharacterized glyoxalase superfamily protein PhnB